MPRSVYANNKTKRTFILTLLSVFSLIFFAQPSSAEDPLNPRLPAYDHSALHRVDFRVTGKSCAVCLHKIQERMKGLTGAVEAAVMLKKPYGAVVIYDSSKVTVKAILEAAVKGEPEVKIVDVKDESIKKLPIVLIPIYSQVPGDS